MKRKVWVVGLVVSLLCGCTTVKVPTAGRDVDVTATGVGAQLAASTAPGTPGILVGMFKVHVRTSPVADKTLYAVRAFGGTSMANTSWNPFNTSFDDFYGVGDVNVSVTNGQAILPKVSMTLAPPK